MKKSFTLLELLISISIFSITIVFLYKTLDQTKYSNILFSKKQETLKQSNHLHNILLEDVTESNSTPTVTPDKNKNSIVKINTSNTYHDAFFNNVTYLVGNTKKLLRIESEKVFTEFEAKNIDFYRNAYIDVLLEDIEYFELNNEQNKNSYNFVIKQKAKDRVIYNTFIVKSVSSNNSSTIDSSKKDSISTTETNSTSAAK